MGQLYVVIRLESVFTHILEIEALKTVIGRNVDCGIQLPDNLVSREHALLSKTKNGYQICDLGSRNGTFLNGRQIHCDESLNDGVEVQIRPYLLKICFSIAKAVKETAFTDDSTRSANMEGHAEGINEPNAPRLTARQQCVYDLFAQGFIEKEVAKRLGITIGTVHDHAKAIYKALSVSTRGELVLRWANSQSRRTDAD